MNAHDPRMHGLPQGLTGPQRADEARAAMARAANPASVKPDYSKYNAAKRYTKRVKILKIGLPVLGTAFIVLFIVLAFTSNGLRTPLGVATLDLTNGQIVMEKPSLNGFTASNSAYEIVANRALQDLDDPKTVLLERIGATLTLDDGNIASVDAGNGRFNMDQEHLTLSNGVNIHMSTGYQAELSGANINVKEGVLHSEGQIVIQSTLGEIRADRLEVRNNGEYVLFEDRVKMIVQPDQLHARE